MYVLTLGVSHFKSACTIVAVFEAFVFHVGIQNGKLRRGKAAKYGRARFIVEGEPFSSY